MGMGWVGLGWNGFVWVLWERGEFGVEINVCTIIRGLQTKDGDFTRGTVTSAVANEEINTIYVCHK